MGMLDEIFSHGLYRPDGHADVLLMPKDEKDPEPPVQHMAPFGSEAGIDTPMPPEPPEMEWVTQYEKNAEGLIVRARRFQVEKGADPAQYTKTHTMVYHVRDILRDESGAPLGKREYTVTEGKKE